MNPVPLFGVSLDDFLQERRNQIYAAADAGYPGDLVTGPARGDAAHKIAAPFMVEVPALVEGRAGVVLQPFDQNELPRGVPGPSESRRAVRVRLLVTGSPYVLRIRPSSGARGGWPVGTVEADGLAVVARETLGDLDIERLRETVAGGLAQLARDLAVYQPVGFVLSRWQERREEAARRAREDERAREKLSRLGYPLA